MGAAMRYVGITQTPAHELVRDEFGPQLLVPGTVVVLVASGLLASERDPDRRA
jgi:hypothetical protein